MAILLEGSDGAPVIWGKIGEFVIQRTKRGTMYIRKHVIPANPRTAAQQYNRMAFKAGIDRWRTHERLTHKEYWDEIAKKRRFRDGYRAFLSSFMRVYQEKVIALAGESPALSWVMDLGNHIGYLESPGKLLLDNKNEELISAVMKRRASWIFQSQFERSLSNLYALGWLDRIRFGLLPLADSANEWEIHRLGLLRAG
ncbi:MAG: hypothetical protein OEZ36_11610 [Spirochaetota bacterium]|nr:hypothetical protein [Spirochaetota bacterium]